MKFDITFMTLSGARHIMEIENPSDEISYFKLISYANNGLSIDDNLIRLRIFIEGDEDVLNPRSSIRLTNETCNNFFALEQPLDIKATSELWNTIYGGGCIDFEKLQKTLENGAKMITSWSHWYPVYITFEKYDINLR